MLTTGWVARRLGLSSERIRQLEREGKLKAERTASGVRIFHEADVDRLERERQEREDA